MKKTVSLLLALCMAALCCAAAFAAGEPQFGLEITEQTGSKVVVTVNCIAGSGFNALDMELEYPATLTAQSGVLGKSLKAFRTEVEDKDGAVLASINPTSRPVKMTIATTETYNDDNGTELFVVTFRNDGKEKAKPEDFSFAVTNCADSQYKQVKYIIADRSVEFPTVTDKDGKPVETSAAEKSSEAQAPVTVGDGKTTQLPTDAEQAASEKKNEDADTDTDSLSSIETIGATESKTSPKKLIIIIATVICILLIAAAVIVYVVSKSKKNGDDSAEKDEDAENKNE